MASIATVSHSCAATFAIACKSQWLQIIVTLVMHVKSLNNVCVADFLVLSELSKSVLRTTSRLGPERVLELSLVFLLIALVD